MGARTGVANVIGASIGIGGAACTVWREDLWAVGIKAIAKLSGIALAG